MSDAFPDHQLRPDQDVNEPSILVGKAAHVSWYSRIFFGETYEKRPLMTVTVVAVSVFALASLLTYSIVNGSAVNSFSRAVFAAAGGVFGSAR